MLLIFFAEISTIGVRRSGWKIEETEFEVLMRGDAGWRLLPVERFLDFPGVGSVYRAPPHTMQPPVLGSKSWSTKG